MHKHLKHETKILEDIHRQSGKNPDYMHDLARFAYPPGKRMSASGKIYWETRKNRSDLNPKKGI